MKTLGRATEGGGGQALVEADSDALFERLPAAS